MKVELTQIDKEFVDTCLSVEPYNNLARAKGFQEKCIKELNDYLDKLIDYKNSAIKRKNESEANRILYYQCIIKTLISEFNMWLSFKMSNPDQAWDHLINAQSNLRAATLAIDIEEKLDNYITKLHHLEKFLFPPQLFMSVGIKSKIRTCSICGAEYKNCEHIKNYPYMGKLCCTIVEKCELEEISIVPNPANKHCRMITTTDNGVKRNHMTWKKIKE